MKKNNTSVLLLFVVSLFTNIVTAQTAPEPAYLKYLWEELPQVSKITDLEAKESEIILKDNKLIEYAYDEKGNLITYITKHKKVKVNNDKGIEYNNKIYIPMRGVKEFVDVKARSISKDGKVNIIAGSAIKEVDDIEGAGPFKIVAVEGIETGSEVEYMYTFIKYGNYFGTENIQGDVPKKNVGLTIISPKNLSFEAKVYNSPIKVDKDTVLEEQNKISVNFPSVAAQKEEKYAANTANLTRIEYKLAYNSARGKMRLFTWDDAASKYYAMFHANDKKDLSASHSLLKKLNLDKLSEEEKIRKIESHLKLNFKINDELGEEGDLVKNIVDKKYGSKFGLVKLFLACFQDQNIACELVFTSNRLNQKFDADFDTWNFLDEYLIYFPTLDKYLSPTSIVNRLGFPPYEYLGNKGLFIKEVEIGDLKSAISKIKTIKPLPYDLSIHTTIVKANIAPDFSDVSLQLLQSYTGYTACFTQTIYQLIPDADKIKLQEQNLKITGEDAKLTDIKVSNDAEEDVLVKPFTMECKLSTPSLIEKAGPKYIFKVGTLIGPQAELYQEDERKLDGEIYYTHGFVREIEITIPENYKAENLDKINFNVEYKEGTDVLAEFKSSYTLQGNKLIIKVAENYRILTYPLARFNDFRKVINAAADFNKVTIVLEKKN